MTHRARIVLFQETPKELLLTVTCYLRCRNWNGGQTINCPAYHAGDGTPASTKSLQGIIDIWRAVSEDFSMFEVDVTTENPGLEALRKTTSTDTSYGIHVVIGPCKYWRPDAGGVAYLGSFTWSTDTVVWAFTDNLGNGTPKYTWEAVSHEVGHSFNLYHDGVSGGSAYYSGHAGWAPIMVSHEQALLTHPAVHMFPFVDVLFLCNPAGSWLLPAIVSMVKRRIRQCEQRGG